MVNKIVDFSKAKKPETKTESKEQKQPGRVEKIIKLAESLCEFWHDDNGDPFATFEANGHREHWKVDSRGFKEWLSRQSFINKLGSLSKDVMAEACSGLCGIAKYEGKKYATGRRVMMHEGAYWIDLTNDEWQAVRIDRDGWRIVDNPGVRFLRNRNVRPLPMPVPGGSPRDIFKLLNVPEEDELLVLAWILECYRVDTQYPVIELTGEQGSAKSATQAVLKLFVDNSAVNLRAKPKTVESVYVAAHNCHLISYENLSALNSDLSDAFCVIATGGGYSDRALYTNSEESVMQAKNPIVLNGINRIITKPDLLDRAITISCPLIKRRISETEHKRLTNKMAPAIFGGLLDLFSKTLALLPSVKIDPSIIPRMTDFAMLGEAMSRALGNDHGVFVEKYIETRKELVANTIDATPLGRAIIRFIECEYSHIGTVGALLHRLNDFETKAGIEPGDFWPKSPRKLGDELRRLAPALRQLGIDCSIESKARRDGVHCVLKK